MNNNVEHLIMPVFDDNSTILILGTMPSPKSRELGFYYAHPQNRFWPVMSELFNVKLDTVESKKKLLHQEGIALWDVIHSCSIDSAADSSIKNVIPNDLQSIIIKSRIKQIFTTGKTAFNLYNKFCKSETGIEAVCLPSTSPANARWRLENLIQEYTVIKEAVAEKK